MERECLSYIYDARNKYDSNRINEIKSSYLQPKSFFNGLKKLFSG